jgi:hypothetical protein
MRVIEATKQVKSMTETYQWSNIDVSIPHAVDTLCSELDNGALAVRSTLFNDPRWVIWHADHAEKSARVYALRKRSGGLEGIGTFLVHPSALRLALGEVTLFSRPVSRLTAFASPVIVGDHDSGDGEISTLVGLLDCIRQDLAPNEVVFLEAVAQESALFELLNCPAILTNKFEVLQYGNLYRHRVAAIGDSFDVYLKQLKARTRSDLKATRKRFIAHVNQNYRTRCFRRPAEVPQFLDEAIELSRKTWQYRLLGSGLRQRDTLEHFYTEAAKLEWFRSYILYANAKPIAFHVGFVYRRRFHSAVIGYDPEWGKHHAGIFLFTEIVHDLCAGDDSVNEFDFGNDDDVYKERLSTGYRTEGYFYLIPADLKGRVLARAMRATNKMSSALGAALGFIGFRKRTRDFLRKLGVMR